MTTITASNNYAGAFNDLFEVSNLASMTGSSASMTSFTLSESPAPSEGGETRIVFNGFGFNSYTGNFANTGTIQVIQVSEWDEVASAYVMTAVWTGMNVSAATLLAAIQNPSQPAGDAAFLDAIFGGADSLTGANDFEDTLFGYGGADAIYGGGNSDELNGGAGNDFIHVYGESNEGVILNGGGDVDTLVAWGNVVSGVETVDVRLATITDFDNIAFVALNADVTGISLQITAAQIAASFAALPSVTGDTLNARCNLIIDSISNLDMRGWSFFDWDPSQFGDAVLLNAASSGSVIYAHADARSQMYGSTGADQLYGSNYNDRLEAQAFSSVGDGDADHLYGGDGDDQYFIYELGDIIHENLNEGFDYAGVYANNYVMADHLDSMALFVANGVAYGNALANGMQGSNFMAATETLYGMAGEDDLFGWGANDILIGGADGDTLNGGDGADTASYAGSAAVNVNLTTGAASGGHAAGDSFNSIENLGGSGFGDTFTGSAGINTLNGAAGNDVLKGMGGADTLIGGAGKDTLTGGVAADKFVFNVAATAANVDTVTDFTRNSDTIQLENSVFTALGAAALNLAATKFWIGANAHDANDRIIYNDATGKLYYDADGNRAGAKVLIATLDTGLNLSAGDFQVI